MVGCGLWSTRHGPAADTGRRSAHLGFSHIATAVEVFVVFDGPCQPPFGLLVGSYGIIQLFGLLGSYGGILQLVAMVRHRDVDWTERKVVADLQGWVAIVGMASNRRLWTWQQQRWKGGWEGSCAVCHLGPSLWVLFQRLQGGTLSRLAPDFSVRTHGRFSEEKSHKNRESKHSISRCVRMCEIQRGKSPMKIEKVNTPYLLVLAIPLLEPLCPARDRRQRLTERTSQPRCLLLALSSFDGWQHPGEAVCPTVYC
eukprot:SAG31_NODE_3387_length_4330_cov_3.992437_4_plen_255_part_00